MPNFFNKYPYTDFHELNLDWVLETVKRIAAEWAETLEEWHNTQEEWQQLYDYVHDYFDNLDVQEEINHKLDAMALDGTLATICDPIIRAQVTADLPDIVDSKLGAVVSDQIDAVVADQIDDAVAAEIGGAVAPAVADWLDDHITQPTTPVIDTSLSVVGAAADAAAVGDAITDLRYADSYGVGIERDGLTYQQGYFNNNGQIVSSNKYICAVTYFPVGSKIHVDVTSGYSYILAEWSKFGQIYDKQHIRKSLQDDITISYPYQIFQVVKGNPSSPDDIDPTTDKDALTVTGIFEDIPKDAYTVIESSDLQFEWSNGTYGSDMKTQPNANGLISKIMHLPVGTQLYVTFKKPGFRIGVTEWHTIGGTYTYTTSSLAGGASYTIQDEYQIFSIIKNPVAAITPDEAYRAVTVTDITTDKGAEISDALKVANTVRLTDGYYNISSQIDMPVYSSIIGNGPATEIHSSAATLITMNNRSLVKDLLIIGTINSAPAAINSYIGIDIAYPRTENKIENVTFSGIDGIAIKLYNTYSVRHLQHVIKNCNFEYCGCGVYLGTKAEGCQVEGCAFNDCFTGLFCIGGNNRIENNLFRTCSYAIDMRTNDPTDNNGHSAFTGDIIIHNTVGIITENIVNGSIFTGCTLFYSPVSIKDSKGIMFIGCQMGTPPNLVANNSPGCRISNSILSAHGTITNIALNDCTDYNGNTIT